MLVLVGQLCRGAFLIGLPPCPLGGELGLVLLVTSLPSRPFGRELILVLFLVGLPRRPFASKLGQSLGVGPERSAISGGSRPFRRRLGGRSRQGRICLSCGW